MKISLDMGHNPNAGACKYLNETTENRKIGNRLIEMLREKGHTVYNCTNDNASYQLQGIVNNEHKNKSDLFVSLHLNSGGGKGTETFTVPGASASTKAKALAINNEVVRSCNFNNRGIKTANFYVLRYTNAPAILVEVCFVDSLEDKSKLNTEKVAAAIFKGITGVVYIPNSFKVKINTDSLNVRSGPGTSYRVTATVRRNEVYTIISTTGSWGKLKSGAGFIYLDYTVKC